eukprot:1165910-Prorocentrum_minimum.AAC.1
MSRKRIPYSEALESKSKISPGYLHIADGRLEVYKDKPCKNKQINTKRAVFDPTKQEAYDAQVGMEPNGE